MGLCLCRSSLELSAALGMVNMNTLWKRLKILGLQPDVVELKRKWLPLRNCFVSLDGDCSNSYESEAGTVKGSLSRQEHPFALTVVNFDQRFWCYAPKNTGEIFFTPKKAEKC